MFISYSRADLAQVRALTLALRRCGLGTWVDLEDLQPGQRWKDAIGQALAASDAIVFCMSALSMESAWTGVELRQARALGLPILPVAIEALDLGRLPEGLRDLHVHDMHRHAPRDAALRTARGIAAALCVEVGAVDPDTPRADDVRDLIRFAMGGAYAAGIGDESVADCIDFRAVDRIRLHDVVHAASQARRAELLVGPATDPALAGLVLGTLCQAFGSRRVTLVRHGPASPLIDAAARVAGVLLDSR